MSFIDNLKKIFNIKSKNQTAEEEGAENISLGSAEFDALKKKYKALYRAAIGLKINNAAKSGSITHFGGKPFVPKDFEWPYFETNAFDDPSSEILPRPLAFLAQFDCREFAGYDTHNILPHTGVLSFFYSIESNCWGFDPADKDCSRVYWFEDINALVPAALPSDLADDSRFPSLAIDLAAEASYPDYEELPEGYDSDEYEEFFEALHDSDDENITKLLGWADTIQSAMETECELIANGCYLGSDWNKIPQQIREEAERTAADKWQLLFQLDTVENDGFELMFGDGGRLYFWIRKEDLAARRFDRVWLILQCY